MPLHQHNHVAPAEEEGTPPATRSGVGTFALFVVIVLFLSIGATTIQVIAADIRETQRETEEAARPANVQITTVVAGECTRCYNVTGLTNGIAQNKNVKVTDQQTIDYTSPEGAALVKQYGLVRVPAFILQGEMTKLMSALPQLKSYGKQQGDDFVGENLPAPYVDVASGDVGGEFNATFITEKQCTECYDLAIIRQALAQLGMVAWEETTVDRTDSDGQKLVQQYSLTATPAVILSGDLAAYAGFDQVWKTVGTIESDGAYVLRSPQEWMGPYYDLETKNVVVPEKK